MNLAYFNKYARALNTNNESTYEEMEEEFTGECEDMAEQLMIRRPKSHQYFLMDFVDEYLTKMRKGHITPKRAIEKYVLSVAYGKGVMDRKFRTKYGSAPEAKLARLENIRRKINSATNNFNWANVNDPDYYDLNAASNYTNIDWYTNSLNGRISNYRRRVNATRSPAVGASRST